MLCGLWFGQCRIEKSKNRATNNFYLIWYEPDLQLLLLISDHVPHDFYICSTKMENFLLIFRKKSYINFCCHKKKECLLFWSCSDIVRTLKGNVTDKMCLSVCTSKLQHCSNVKGVQLTPALLPPMVNVYCWQQRVVP